MTSEELLAMMKVGKLEKQIDKSTTLQEKVLETLDKIEPINITLEVQAGLLNLLEDEKMIFRKNRSLALTLQNKLIDYLLEEGLEPPEIKEVGLKRG